MKKILFTLAIITACSACYADGNAFTPLNFNDTEYAGSGNVSQAPAAYENTVTEVEAVGNGNIQNAISQLDNAQVDIRADLVNYRTKFSDIDAQYRLVKTERASLKKQIRSIEKRIKEIDKAKETIRKNML